MWDEYIPNSLKASAGQKRGTGARRRVLPSAMVLRNWQEFLRLDNNKKDLFLFVSEQVVRTAIEGKQIIVTRGEEVLCSPLWTRRNTLSPCSHQKVDTRMMVHIADAVQDGYQWRRFVCYIILQLFCYISFRMTLCVSVLGMSPLAK